MEFCRKCDSMIVRGVCPKCFGLKKNEPNIRVTIKNNKKIERVQPQLITPKEVTEAICRNKCGSTQAYITKHQLRAGDEAETLILTCIKCNKTWRI